MMNFSRRFLTTAILTLLTMLTTVPASAQRKPPSEWKWVDDNIADGCTHHTFESPSMKRTIGYSVWLPPGYSDSPSRRYPVVYYLHGAGGSESSSREFAWAVRQAVDEDVIQDVIYVFPNGGHYSGYRDRDDGSVMAETWIVRELIPHIDATLRTIPDRESRALCGWSMGGGGALRFLMKYPDMFCAAAAISAAVNMRGENGDDSVQANLTKNLQKIRGRVAVWMAVGESDRLRAGNEKLSQLLTDHNVDHSLQVLPDTGHNLGQMSARYHREIVVMLDKHLQNHPDDSEGEGIRIVADDPYRPNAKTDYERERCKLDWYFPDGVKDFPTIVWFHGGGLQNGHKAGPHEVAMAKRFAADGIAIASVNYRLSPKAQYPAYIKDAAAAVAHVVRHAAEHGGDVKRVFVSGHSAGGYLTAMVGMDERYLKAHQLTTSALAGFIPVSGQMVTHSTVRGERGIPRTRPIIDEAAPSYHASGQRPPFLCIAGSNDLPARAEENRYFVAAMKAAGHTAIRYAEYQGRDHSTIASQLNQVGDEVARDIQVFVRNKQNRGMNAD